MTIRFVLLLTVILHLAFTGSRVTLSLFALHLQATPLTVGILISLLAAVPLLFAVGWGRTIDRIGVRKPLLIGAGTVLGALLLGAAVPRIEVLFIVSAVVGSHCGGAGGSQQQHTHGNGETVGHGGSPGRTSQQQGALRGQRCN